ncbi:MAG: precorrin-6y C5,15-methyltransferase (decarboxylating) subunit CbiE [Gammaproteobacteria bacterium]|nr:MAG: precorrin-6y C5,15-methyltransferase (decarboxylating) subunit CbiE [Gammaproteobacteria bacterium]
MGPKIDVLGIGCDDAGNFSVAAAKALNEAEIIFASDEQAALIRSYFSQLKAQFESYPRPISKLEKSLADDQHKKIVMLALGDPLFYGIGAILLRFLPAERLRFHPAISSLQAALSRFSVPWNDLSVISLHGRALSSFAGSIGSKGRYGILTDAKNSPQRIAKELVKIGQENALVRVAESLGRKDERLSIYNAMELADCKQHFSPLLVLVVDIV